MCWRFVIILKTPVPIHRLCRPFALAEHEFNYDGFAYVSEAPICARMEEIDPAWRMTEPQFEISDDPEHERRRVICKLAVTILGVTRWGVGEHPLYTKTKSGALISNEAHKASATDALRRAARLFGIGRYLLSAPKGQKQFEVWYRREHASNRQDGNWRDEFAVKAQIEEVRAKIVELCGAEGAREVIAAAGSLEDYSSLADYLDRLRILTAQQREGKT